jgi:hypothetical protein
MFSGNLSAKELRPINKDICLSKHDDLSSGNTIEVHYVYSTAQVKPFVFQTNKFILNVILWNPILIAPETKV